MDFSPFQKKKPDWALGAKEGEGKARPSPIVTLSFFILFLIFSSFIFPYNLYAQYFQDCNSKTIPITFLVCNVKIANKCYCF